LAYRCQHPFSRGGVSHAVALAKIQILLDRHFFLAGPFISCRIVLKDFHLHGSFEVNLSSANACAEAGFLPRNSIIRVLSFISIGLAGNLDLFPEPRHTPTRMSPPLRSAARFFGAAMKTGFIFAYYPNHCIKH
ncbi:MAG: hypothetical protein ACJ8G3_24580, partial [Burkholderiaceae bacterium]